MPACDISIMNQPRSQLFGYVRKHKGALWIALALACIVGLLEAAIPFLIGGVFTWLGGNVSGTRTPSLFGINLDLSYLGGTTLLSLLVGITILKAASEYVSVTVTAWLGQAVVRDLRNDVFGRILRQPLQFFLQSSTGELISRVSTDIERVQTAASETLAEFLKQSAILVFLTITIFVIDWRLTLGSLVLIPAVFYPTLWFGKKLRRLSRSNQEELGEMANVVNEAFSGNRIVKAFSMEDAEGRRFQDVTQRLFRTNLKQKMTHALSSPMMETLGILAVVGFVVYARERQMNPGLLIVFILGLIKLYDAVRRMSGFNNSFQQAFGASSRIFEILALPEERDSGSRELTGFTNAIEFRDVQFGYSADAAVLHRVDFEVVKGEVVAIVGASGSGKSTLVNLVPRFFDVSGGSISIDGIDLRDCTLQSLRRQMAIVTQDVILFDDTIWGNIAYGNPASSRERVIAAAKAALVDDFVSLLPAKYDTRIGERGLRLSGGERQRISIARALLKDAPILILDEATSSLDSESEVYVQRALQNLMEGRTTIVIAHRLSTVRRADKIVVLQDGRIQEMGRHEDLIAKRGVYWRLHSIQEPRTTRT
jgi:ATP-binding cassette, subfamily B, bacterial MsbA